MALPPPVGVGAAGGIQKSGGKLVLRGASAPNAGRSAPIPADLAFHRRETRFPSRSLDWPHHVPDNGKIYAVLVVLRHMMHTVSPNAFWRDRLFTLALDHPKVPLDAMGVPQDWQRRVTWR